MSPLRGIRGAVQAASDGADAIDRATRELLAAIVETNRLDPAAIAAVWFTQTPDLTAAYPAASARRFGWREVPMMCAQEAAVAGGLPRTIRTLVLAPPGDGSGPVRHVYLGATRALRPDLSPKETRPS